MKRAIAMVIVCCVATASAEAQTQNPPATLPAFKPPPTFALDTVLFRLPRADLVPGQLVTRGERRSGQRLYWGGPVAAKGKRIVRRCSSTKDGLVWITDGFKLRSDGVRVGEMRLALGACGPEPFLR
jgi:hypothetical protein